ncbi:Actin-related protein 10 [Strongyloides ratti]|uniref:Actin-related protein 10 n=1 Tax=Strongyloides ratti TaxID=34506 RepID=A0A090LH45_STRRB|nr:Actin-related protein 10 [Strongyloides ratti]CEF69102.1 Actin-related protein 10 [Strongyloides ratti]
MASDNTVTSTSSYQDISRRSSNMSTISSGSRTLSRVEQILKEPSSISVKTAIVLEFGNRLTKVGIAGEFRPRRVIRSEVTLPNEIEPTNVFSNEYSDEKQKKVLTAFIRKIAFNVLILPFKDRSFVVVFRTLENDRLQYIITDILKNNKIFNAQEVKFIPSQIAATIGSYCAEVGLVVDIGYEFASIFPVIHNCILFHEGEISLSCSKKLEERVRELLIKYGSVRIHGTKEIKNIDNDILDILDKTKTYEDICNKYLFVTTLERSRKLDKYEDLQPQPKGFEMILKDFTLVVPGCLRELAAEILFTTTDDSMSIPEAILEVITNCPIDFRKLLFERLIICGGVAELPGFLGRIKAELLDAITSSEYIKLSKLNVPKFIQYPNSKIPFGLVINWIGGSLYASSAF